MLADLEARQFFELTHCSSRDRGVLGQVGEMFLCLNTKLDRRVFFNDFLCFGCY